MKPPRRIRQFSSGLFVIVFAIGCSQDMTNVNSDRAILAKIVMEEYSEGWTTAANISIFENGHFHAVIYDSGMRTVSRADDGILKEPDRLALVRKVRNSDKFKIVAGEPTYKFGADDSMFADQDIRELVLRMVNQTYTNRS